MSLAVYRIPDLIAFIRDHASMSDKQIVAAWNALHPAEGTYFAQVRQLRNDNAIPRPIDNTRWSHGELVAVRSAYAAGESAGEIAQRLGRSVRAVERIIARTGLVRSPRRARHADARS